MDEYRSRLNDSSHGYQPPPDSGQEIQFAPSVEKRLLQLISAHAPLPEVLNKICSALDYQIGNVVSLIFPTGDDASKRTGIAKNAALFGLHIFCTEGVIGENNQLLGFLVMYNCIPRNPSASEFQWIERAKCLATLAIKRDMEAGDQRDRAVHQNRPARGRLLERLVFMPLIRMRKCPQRDRHPSSL